MESKCSDNVLAEIEENFQEIVRNDDKEDIGKLDEAELLEEFDVVDSWEVDGGDDGTSRKSDRRSRGSSYSRRRNDRSSRRDTSHDTSHYRSRKSIYKRPRSRSKSRSRDSKDHRRPPKRLSDRKIDDKTTVEHLKEPSPGSSQKVEKLPDLKCTTSIETGEVNVVLLTEDKNDVDSLTEKEALEDDDANKKHPLLLKNPFALARLRRKRSLSADKIQVRELSLSPRYKAEKYKRESRVVGARNKDRSVSPYRPRSKQRSSPSLYDRKSSRRSISLSPERHASHRASDHRYREGGRWHGRSREGSILSRVSSRSSLSFISSDEMSPRDHNRKRSPLRTKVYAPKGKGRGLTINNENFMSSSEDFDHKLSLLLKEGKQKQSFGNDSPACTPAEYPSSSWRPAEWTNQNTSHVSNNNYPCDTSVKPDYNTNVHHNAYPGFTPDQYNQATYYNNSQPTNYASGYAGDTTNTMQPPYNYGNQYQNQIPNQFYPQMPAAPASVPTTYPNTQNMAPFQPVDSLQSHAVPPVAGTQPMVHTGHQSYPTGGDQMNYMAVPPPLMNVQVSIHPDTSTVQPTRDVPGQMNYMAVPPPLMNVPVNKHQDTPTVQPTRDVPEWNKYNRTRVPTRLNIPLTSEEPIMKEEDPMRTPPPPVISDTWREIESGGKKLSSLLEDANKKRDVISRCEEMLQKMLSNDPVMERFKITQCENMHHFLVKEVPKPKEEPKTRNAMKSSKLAMKKKRLISPLLRKETNPYVKLVPWLPGDEDPEPEKLEISDQCGEQLPQSLSHQVNEEICPSCVAKRDHMVSASTQTEKQLTNEAAVQVEDDWNHYYPNSNFKNSNSAYSAWYR